MPHTSRLALYICLRHYCWGILCPCRFVWWIISQGTALANGYLFASYAMIQGFSKEMACSKEDASLNFIADSGSCLQRLAPRKVIDTLPSFLRKLRQHGKWWNWQCRSFQGNCLSFPQALRFSELVALCSSRRFALVDDDSRFLHTSNYFGSAFIFPHWSSLSCF